MIIEESAPFEMPKLCKSQTKISVIKSATAIGNFQPHSIEENIHHNGPVVAALRCQPWQAEDSSNALSTRHHAKSLGTYFFDGGQSLHFSPRWDQNRFAIMKVHFIHHNLLKFILQKKTMVGEASATCDQKVNHL